VTATERHGGGQRATSTEVVYDGLAERRVVKVKTVIAEIL